MHTNTVYTFPLKFRARKSLLKGIFIVNVNYYLILKTTVDYLITNLIENASPFEDQPGNITASQQLVL